MRVLALVALLPVSSLFAQLTESPDTIQPGRFLLEIDGVKLSYDRPDANGEEHTAVTLASTVLSVGLTKTVDLQIGADFFLKNTLEFRGVRESHAGRGDVFFRTKWTFWRDNALGAAIAVIPYVKIPSNTGGVGNGSVEGGFILPWAMKLGETLSTGAQFQWDQLRNANNDGYDAHWHLTAFAQHDFTKRFAVYAEAVSTFSSTGFSDWSGQIGAGALVQCTERVQLDYELQRGLNHRATDWVHVFRVNWAW